uniref:NADH-plastoquinone oxidoreductase subunit 2 n=1 Tax=Panagrolaimus sp. JU765 TaxID=591449 RepID=A0AC34RQG3_9BILA
MGIGFGLLSVYRTFIAMETKEHERSKGFGACLIAEAIGLFLAPVLQLASSLLDYPGWESPIGVHVNIYTAPVILSLISCLIGYICFHFYFNGKLAIPESPQSNLDTISQSIDSTTEILKPESKSYDKLAFIILIIAKIGTGLITIIFSSITSIYAMKVFAWTSGEL